MNAQIERQITLLDMQPSNRRFVQLRTPRTLRDADLPSDSELNNPPQPNRWRLLCMGALVSFTVCTTLLLVARQLGWIA